MSLMKKLYLHQPLNTNACFTCTDNKIDIYIYIYLYRYNLDIQGVASLEVFSASEVQRKFSRVEASDIH